MSPNNRRNPPTVKVLPVRALITLALLSTAPSGAVDFVSIELVPGTDPEYEAEIRAMLAQDPVAQAERAKDIAQVNYERQSMAEQGFVVAPDELVAAHVRLSTSPDLVDRSEVEPRLGFDPAAFQLGFPIIGVLYDVSEDDQIHNLTSLIEHPSLGVVRIRERSLATEPRGRMSRYLYGPPFDALVNGYPALLTVYRTQDGALGRSDLSILQQGRKLMTVGVGRALLPEDPLYSAMFALASDLAAR